MSLNPGTSKEEKGDKRSSVNVLGFLKTPEASSQDSAALKPQKLTFGASSCVTATMDASKTIVLKEKKPELTEKKVRKRDVKKGQEREVKKFRKRDVKKGQEREVKKVRKREVKKVQKGDEARTPKIMDKRKAMRIARKQRKKRKKAQQEKEKNSITNLSYSSHPVKLQS